MKNDFREFYDENYIMHTAMSNATEEELMHGEWTSNLRKYVDKVRTRTGKWKYIYPEDLKKKAENVKRDISYAARNLKSKITRTNKTFNKKVAGFNNNGNVDGSGHWEGVTYDLKPNGHKIKVTKNKYGALELPSGGVTYVNTKEKIHNAYAKEQKKGGIGMSKYAERKRRESQLKAANANKQYYDQTGKKEKAERKTRQLNAANANKQYYDKTFTNPLKKKSRKKNISGVVATVKTRKRNKG